MTWAIFIVVALVSSLGWHRAVRSKGWANLGAACTSVVVFQVLAFVQLGYLDPFFMIGMAMSAPVALLIAVLVGALVKR
jgi:hypothetical protein